MCKMNNVYNMHSMCCCTLCIIFAESIRVRRNALVSVSLSAKYYLHRYLYPHHVHNNMLKEVPIRRKSDIKL